MPGEGEGGGAGGGERHALRRAEASLTERGHRQLNRTTYRPFHLTDSCRQYLAAMLTLLNTAKKEGEAARKASNGAIPVRPPQTLQTPQTTRCVDD